VSTDTLFDLDQYIAEAVRLPTAAGHFTGELLAEREPAKYAAAVRLVAAGLPRIQIASTLHISHHTLLAVIRREGAAIAQEKERLKRLALYGAGLCMESILDDLADEEKRAKMLPRDKAWIAGVLTDKGLVLGGDATVIHEIRSAPDHEAFNRAIEAEGVEVGPAATGLGGETPGQKGSVEPGADELAAVVEAPSGVPAAPAARLLTAGQVPAIEGAKHD